MWRATYSHGQIRVDTLFFTLYYQQILLHSTVYNNEVDKFMDKRFRRLYLHKIAFNLIPQRLSCTKAKNIRESRKRNMILISLPSSRMCCTIMVHFIGVPIIKSCSSSLTP